MRILLALLLALMIPVEALAADLTVELKTAAGQPVGNAVVSYRPASGAAGPVRYPGPYVVSQSDAHFDPFIVLAPVGAEVAFPNKDKVRHHVYSFSIAKRFEIRLYGRDETRRITFDKAGVVALGCNIHDQMMGFVVVLDTPIAAKVGPSGEVTLANVPPGTLPAFRYQVAGLAGVLTVWQPFLRTPGNQIVQPVTIPAQGAVHAALTLNLRPPPTDKTPLL